MSRYIDADNLQRHGNRGGVVYWRDIEAQTTADVVEVVRCKDCKWWDNEDDAERCTHKYNTMWAKPDEYCSYGERKEE